MQHVSARTWAKKSSSKNDRKLDGEPSKRTFRVGKIAIGELDQSLTQKGSPVQCMFASNVWECSRSKTLICIRSNSEAIANLYMYHVCVCVCLRLLCALLVRIKRRKKGQQTQRKREERRRERARPPRPSTTNTFAQPWSHNCGYRIA